MPRCSPVLRVPPSVERILVIRLGALGDVVRTLPAVAGLRSRHPDTHISWLVEPASAGLVALSPAVDEVRVFPRPALVQNLRSLRFDRLARGLADQVGALRAARFDLVIDFHGLLKSGLLARSTGAAMRVGAARPHSREGSAWLMTHRAELGPAKRSRYARNAGIAGFLGAGIPDATDEIIAVPRAVTDRMLARLDGERPGVLLHPGTSPGTPYKRWAPGRFSALAHALAEATGARCLVTSGSDEAERRLAREIVAGSDGAARLAPVTEDLAELAALLELAPLCIGSDSGPLHLAALLGTPVVQILGPTDPVENAPFAATPNRVVREHVPCSPCRRGCGNPICMQAVSIERVTVAARSLLGAREAIRTSPPWRAA
jgi:lipopolysaccharide heptosyltransferase I